MSDVPAFDPTASITLPEVVVTPQEADPAANMSRGTDPAAAPWDRFSYIPVEHDPFSGKLGDFGPSDKVAGKIGAGPETAAETALRWGIEGLGGNQVVDAAKIYKALHSGNYEEAAAPAVNLGLSAIPMAVGLPAGPMAGTLADAVGMGAGNALRRGAGVVGDVMRDETGAIRAYHGSPSDFDAFDPERVDTGIGADEGHGVYVAGREKTAEFFKHGVYSYNGKLLEQLNPDELPVKNAEELEFARALTGQGNPHYARAYIPDAKLPRFDDYVDQLALKDVGDGRMYELNVHADPEQFLHWDLPLNKQSPEVQKNLRLMVGAKDNEDLGPMLASEFHDAIVSKDTPRSEVAKLFQEHGIPGIRYVDPSQRPYLRRSNFDPQNVTHHNFVVFDPKMIEIIKKYGITGLIAGGTAAIGGSADAATHVVPVDHNPFAAAPPR